FTLDELASIANFSKFHFSRIFQGMTSETPFQFIQRIRIEKAGFLISHTNDSITEIASKCGFNNLSVFSRNFKSHYQKSPSQYRKAFDENSNLSQVQSKSDQSIAPPSIYFCEHTRTYKWKTNMEQAKSIEVKQLPDIHVAYIRHKGPYAGNSELFNGLFQKLMTWAGPRGLLKFPKTKTLIIYHDDINIADQSKLRTDICITVDKDDVVDGEVGKLTLENGKYAVGYFEIKGDEFKQAWEWIFGQWLPKSGYQPDDKPCFELYPSEPKDGIFAVEICIPVKPL
ncbi:MAG: GyrI-like domain-containing protein, partial [Bacteroidota bacterium]